MDTTHSDLSSSSPLAGLKILDLSRILAGPWATQTLADLGADVTKIERPVVGDDTHTWGPPFVESEVPGAERPRESTYYLCCNRGKTILEVDLTSDLGQKKIRELALDADVVVENFKVGALAKYGLDYPSLSQLNPRLIYCSITGFGQSGPYAPRAGYDALIQAMGGLMSITGEPDEAPGGGPQKVGVAIIDILTGMYATTAILAAVHERARSGRGQHIDLALFEVQIAALANQASAYLIGGQCPGRIGSAHPSIVPYQPFKTRNGHLMLSIANDSQFKAFAAAAGHNELATDARFLSNDQRVQNRQALISILEPILQERETHEWVDLCEKRGVPCGPIHTIAEVFKDPQVEARHVIAETPHPTLGVLKTVANPIRFSRSSLAPTRFI